MHLLGVMQGRLSAPTNGRIQAFPKESWAAEFDRARKCGLDLIEWIFEGDDWQSNPLIESPQKIAAAMTRSGVRVISVCADYFMDFPLVKQGRESKDSFRILDRLIVNSRALGVLYLGIPLVDQSALVSAGDIASFAQAFRGWLRSADLGNLKILLETDLTPEHFADLLKTIGDDRIGVNYDIGNSASLGYSTVEEIRSYGDRIFTVHVKDRVLNGGTVPLGSGNAEFHRTFEALSEVRYQGPFILQAARGVTGEEAEMINKYSTFVRGLLQEHFNR